MKTPVAQWECRPAPEAPDDLGELRAAIRTYLARGGRTLSPRQLSPLERKLVQADRERAERP